MKHPLLDNTTANFLDVVNQIIVAKAAEDPKSTSQSLYIESRKLILESLKVIPCCDFFCELPKNHVALLAKAYGAVVDVVLSEQSYRIMREDTIAPIYQCFAEVFNISAAEFDTKFFVEGGRLHKGKYCGDVILANIALLPFQVSQRGLVEALFSSHTGRDYLPPSLVQELEASQDEKLAGAAVGAESLIPAGRETTPIIMPVQLRAADPVLIARDLYDAKYSLSAVAFVLNELCPKAKRTELGKIVYTFKKLKEGKSERLSFPSNDCLRKLFNKYVAEAESYHYKIDFRDLESTNSG